MAELNSFTKASKRRIACGKKVSEKQSPAKNGRTLFLFHFNSTKETI
jgi:hypothetical protein